jgi:hypothetical protein
MNTEHDEAERLEFTWDGLATLKAARERKARMDWLTQHIRDFAMGRLMRNVPALNVPRAPSVSPPRAGTRAPPASARLLPWSAASVVDLGASFSQPGDPDFVPSTAWQAYEHRRALGG